jgi:hypothetical protein
MDPFETDAEVDRDMHWEYTDIEQRKQACMICTAVAKEAGYCNLASSLRARALLTACHPSPEAPGPPRRIVDGPVSGPSPAGYLIASRSPAGCQIAWIAGRG